MHTNSFADGRCSAFACADILGFTLTELVSCHAQFVAFRSEWWLHAIHCAENDPEYVRFHINDCNGASLAPPDLRSRWIIQNSDALLALRTMQQSLTALVDTKQWHHSAAAKGAETFDTFIAHVFTVRGFPHIQAYNIDLVSVPRTPSLSHAYVHTIVSQHNVIRFTDTARMTSFGSGHCVFFLHVGNHWHSLVTHELLQGKPAGIATRQARSSVVLPVKKLRVVSVLRPFIYMLVYIYIYIYI